jgi:hypothetical protein
MSEEKSETKLLHGHCDEAEQIIKAFGLEGNIFSIDFHLDSRELATLTVLQEVPVSIAEPLGKALKKYHLVEVE